VLVSDLSVAYTSIVDDGGACMSDQRDQKTTKPTQKSGRVRSGLARANALTPDQRSEIARKAANTRHALGRPLEAIRKGNFQEDFGIDAECYVLNDERKTAVMTQRGIAAALGLSSPGGKDFERLVSGKVLSKYIGAEVLERIIQPIEFKWVYPGAKQSETMIKGYGADILIDVSNAILAADAAGQLRGHQSNLARQARVILNASAKSGITGLVYSLAGYRPEIEETIQAFKAFVQAEAKKYESEFPTELYAEWARLYGHKPQRSWKDMHLTINHVYYPLAKSDGKLLSLLREARNSAGDKNAKLFQFLNLVGARALRFQLGRVYDVAQNAESIEEYEREISKRFGGQPMLTLSNG
jgi:hypothetical protein